jgi:hypothetical protein
MAVTFKTKACADVTMLDASAKQVLGLIGKEFGVRGVITAAEAPAALAKIAAAVAAQGGDRGPDEESDPEGARAHVSLKTRLAPFIEMLERAHAGGRDILWGV